MENIDYQSLLEELKLRNEALSHALDEQQTLNSELLAVNRKLTESEALKTHFLSNISNEIINPFTAICGLARSILKLDANDNQAIIRMTSMILSEALHLDFQLKNIFMAAAIEAGEIFPQFQKTRVISILKQLLDSYATEFQHKNIGLSLDLPKQEVDFITDPEKFELLILNLIDNALLFSVKDSLIIISIEINKDALMFRIEDHGIGMSEEEVSKIFNRFTRIENHINSINRGNGLGLSITKALADVLNAKIEVQSEKGKGSVFTVYLPNPGEAALIDLGYSDTGNETFFEDTHIF